MSQGLEATLTTANKVVAMLFDEALNCVTLGVPKLRAPRYFRAEIRILLMS
jgi:hypothetical protein